ncbi:MAG: arginine--tRNA ligase, partial [Bacteroidota bacterium]
MNIQADLIHLIDLAIKKLYGDTSVQVKLESTNADFRGDYTFVVFPLLRFSKATPELTAVAIGNEISSHSLIAEYNVVKGFLNIVVNTQVYLNFLEKQWNNPSFLSTSLGTGKKVMVEYSSPNTNKPLHLGHIRNILLGYSVSNILSANGFETIKANLVNDRGIHICKSMIAWQRFGNGETPQSSGLKGDHLVGKYYVAFENALVEQTRDTLELAKKGQWQPENQTTKERYQKLWLTLQSAKEEKQINKLTDDIKDLVRNQSEIMQATSEMLRQWEAGNPEIIELWSTMNGWVYEGFNTTYTKLGVDFDKYYYESNTYTLGKDIVEEGLQSGVFYQKLDNSVWIDLTGEGLDEKLVLRSDGTSVYITQDIGTADLKYSDFEINNSIYVVGNEQDYHFKVLILIMKKLQRTYANGMYHLSYGMVDLPSGKMKSREGTVVDADDLIQEMINEAKAKTEELGKTDGLAETELQHLYHSLGLSALKFYILKVDPKKRMLFNPQESIDFQGDTGPFVQYTYARIKSILRKAPTVEQWSGTASMNQDSTSLLPVELETIQTLYRYPEVLQEACTAYSPADVCSYCLDLAKSFNRLYNEVSILNEPNESARINRLKIAYFTANTLKHA